MEYFNSFNLKINKLEMITKEKLCNNECGIINNQDFNVWKLQAAALNTYTPADADGNGIVNNLDYNLWKANGSKVSVLKR